MEYSTPAWIDDTTVVTQAGRKNHEKKLFDENLEETPDTEQVKENQFCFKTKWNGWDMKYMRTNKTE